MVIPLDVCGKLYEPVGKDKPETLIIIPARMASNRFPGKPMAMAGGKPLVHWTWERAKQTDADHVIVATPDREIANYCKDHNILWRPTELEHPSGTHRCAEVLEHVRKEKKFNSVVNWQVDEPLVGVGDVNRLLRTTRDSYSEILTLTAPLQIGEVENYNTTKAIVFEDGTCQWFSRATMAGSVGHCGVYSFHPRVLRFVARLELSLLSGAESLEQLTWIEKGFRLRALGMARMPLSINTPEDFEVFRKIVEGEQL